MKSANAEEIRSLLQEPKIKIIQDDKVMEARRIVVHENLRYAMGTRNVETLREAIAATGKVKLLGEKAKMLAIAEDQLKLLEAEEAKHSELIAWLRNALETKEVSKLRTAVVD